jgi:hypothetical protein
MCPVSKKKQGRATALTGRPANGAGAEMGVYKWASFGRVEMGL